MQAGHGTQPGNVGVEWLSAPASWGFYIGILGFARLLVGLAPGVDQAKGWTYVHVAHAVATFVLFHWVKGSPFPTYWAVTSPAADAQTFWEQIDNRWQNTSNRKFCTGIVVMLYYLAVHALPASDLFLHAVNFVSFVVLFIAKLPAMDSVRILNINSGP